VTTPARRLIITCDEFGETHSANLAIFAAIEQGLGVGCPISTTLQMPGPWTCEAASFAVAHPDADVGVHLTIECGLRGMKFRPICGRTEVPGLYGPDGYMWPSGKLAWQHATEDEIYRECRTQIEAALALGVDASHLDGHGGFQGSNPAGYARVCRRLAEEFALPIRLQARSRYEDAGAGAEWDRVRAEEICTSDQCEDLGRRKSDESYAQFFLRRLRQLPGGLTDLYAHPCADSEELRALQPERAEGRIEQGDLLLHIQELRDALAEANVQLCTWRAIREAQRSSSHPRP